MCKFCMKSIFAVLLMTVIVGAAFPAHATTTATVMMAGSSAQWQTLALGAYNSGTSILAGGGTTCHWTSKSNSVNLVDSRVTPANSDPGTLWIVWDNNTSASTCAADGTGTTHVWAYLKNDSVIGVRCYQANPKCKISTAALTYSQQITLPAPVWGADAAAVPSTVAALFTTGTLINSAATDIRPEDAAFAMCRVNSSLGASTLGSGNGSDNLDGLGYNSNNASGVCPAYNSATKQSKGLGTAVLSGVNSPTGPTGGFASVLAFNLTGKDPITNSTVTFPAFTAVGAAPIVFVVEHDKGQLTGAVNATDAGLQAIFSGTNCNGSEVGGGGGGINVFLREPTSGTMNTTEATVFRYPTTYSNAPNTPGVAGKSQETGVNATNPLATTCAGGGGTRYRGVSTSEIVKDGVALSGSTTGCLGGTQCYTNAVDGIGYTFFSYGNVSALADKSAFGYLMLDGVDPIFQSYFAGASGSPIDPGQNTAAAGEIPGAADLPASCGVAGAFPCNERFIWGSGLSFPNLRNGRYRAWSLLRVLGAPAAALATASNKYNVTTVPDYVPAATVTAANGGGTLDPGFEILRSHYQQHDGAGTALAKVANGACVNTVGTTENCGDMGGEVLTKGPAATTAPGTQIVSSMTDTGYSSAFARASTGN